VSDSVNVVKMPSSLVATVAAVEIGVRLLRLHKRVDGKLDLDSFFQDIGLPVELLFYFSTQRINIKVMQTVVIRIVFAFSLNCHAVIMLLISHVAVGAPVCNPFS
jgi:hypothetical protein